MKRFRQFCRSTFLKDTKAGQGLVEYALILLLVAVVVVIILVAMGPQVGSVFSAVSSGFNPNETGISGTPTPCVTKPGNGNIGRCV
jgi:pilus assembly protein Flp/PilA